MKILTRVTFTYAQLGFTKFLVSYGSKFVVKVDFGPCGCKKLPNWVKVTHQNVRMLHIVRRILLTAGPGKKITTFSTIRYILKGNGRR